MKEYYSKTLVINRARWARGENDGMETALLGDGNRKCCLGFYAQQCGYTGMIRDLSDLTEISTCNFTGLTKSDGNATAVHSRLLRTNDAIRISDKERETRISKIFAEIGVKVKFVGKYPKNKETKT